MRDDITPPTLANAPASRFFTEETLLALRDRISAGTWPWWIERPEDPERELVDSLHWAKLNCLSFQQWLDGWGRWVSCTPFVDELAAQHCIACAAGVEMWCSHRPPDLFHRVGTCAFPCDAVPEVWSWFAARFLGLEDDT